MRPAPARIAIVAAVAKNGVIGAGGDLPWKISDDLKWFKKTTLGKPVIMGRKTFDSIGKALSGRDNIVVTRRRDFDPGGVFIARNIPDALTLARQCASAGKADEVCIIGGAEIYALTLDLAERLYLTRVAADVDGDAYFPALDNADWRETRLGGCAQDDRNSHSCEFFILDRRAK